MQNKSNATFFLIYWSIHKTVYAKNFCEHSYYGNSITACTRQELIGNKEFITLSYQQTYCADPWKTGSNDSLTIENVTHYLDSAGLYRAGIHIKSEGGTATCQACACQTGKIIYIITLNSNSIIARYNRIGFK